MNKNFISLGLIVAFTLSTVGVMAETMIYTDAIGRMHFLGKDTASKGVNYNNSAAQDLTRKLYETPTEVNNDTSYDQHPLKNYENTFSDFRFTNFKKRYETDVDEQRLNGERRAKGSFTSEKGVAESGYYQNTQFLEQKDVSEKNIISDTNKKAKKDKKEKKNKKK